MAEKTPTEQGADETSSGVETPQLDAEQQQESAVEQQGTDSGEQSQGTDDDSTTTQTNDDESQSSTDDEGLAKFAKGQGFDDISDFSDRELKLLQRQKKQVDEYRNDPARAKKVKDELKELYKTEEDDTKSDIDSKRIAAVEARQYTDDFWAEHPDDREHETAMVEALQEIRENEGNEALAYWTSNLDKLLVQAKYKSGAFDSDAARESGRREEREALRRKQEGSSDNSHATSQAGRSSGGMTRDELYNLPDDEYIKLRDSGELDAMMARGELY